MSYNLFAIVFNCLIEITNNNNVNNNPTHIAVLINTMVLKIYINNMLR